MICIHRGYGFEHTIDWFAACASAKRFSRGDRYSSSRRGHSAASTRDDSTTQATATSSDILVNGRPEKALSRSSASHEVDGAASREDRRRSNITLQLVGLFTSSRSIYIIIAIRASEMHRNRVQHITRRQAPDVGKWKNTSRMYKCPI